MDTMDPVYGSGTLLLIAAIAVAVLLVLIIALRMHAFVALVLVSFGTAIAAGVPVADVPAISIAAFGSTLGTVALLVGLGVMIGLGGALRRAVGRGHRSPVGFGLHEGRCMRIPLSRADQTSRLTACHVSKAMRLAPALGLGGTGCGSRIPA